jgi:3'-5' exoribonuclease
VNNGIGHFEPMDYIWIDGQVTSFNEALQLNVKRVRRADEGEYDVADYMPCTKKSKETMYQELTALIQSVQEPHLKQLLSSYFIEDADFIKRFQNHSAAKSIHHGFIGGLLQHTLAVAKLCDFYAANYPMLNRDLLITAAIFHDIGKLDEISQFPENDYTDEGQLVGHIVMGAMMVKERIAGIEGFPTQLANELVHCILAHHGELEYGSPKKPALIEAVALTYADNTDAKLQTFTELLENNKDKTSWFGYNKLFESNIRATKES